jgi:DNA-binding NtrC family response regulator
LPDIAWSNAGMCKKYSTRSTTRASDFFAIVSDAEMPGLSVTGLMKAARERIRPIPILLMCGEIHDRAVRCMVEAGEVPFLAKPFTWDVLVRAVRETIDGFDTKRTAS